ncbi:DNA polymerase phi-domain-containing protein [Neohortaea acidophila]|uniref:DNA polymerase phi-domain-containing protein n=1 Tax=Neohortaea acidophila TaxID=245834 RepID=A0A6A6Q611_9PEZI|nr:DNA polymerase phi-domain-containing protein [Neohortaea acidophila]KAF2487414.1 DNA polymerase phi-domain-containing protein [Neohortaea acidophila]
MSKSKRAADGAPLVHPSRQKRVKYSEQDVQLAQIYNDLADEVQSVRIQAAGELLRALSAEASDQRQRLDTAETRLIRGLCSGRKAARLGFSIALAEVFRLKFGVSGEAIPLQSTVDNIITLTTVTGNVSGQEKRDYGLGRRFAFQAVLQSDIGVAKRLPLDEWRYLIKCVYALAAQKQWLRRECGAVVHDYLISLTSSPDPSRIQPFIDELVEHKLAKTPEGVGIWLDVKERFPAVRLPKNVWEHEDPLSGKERALLAKVMLETAVDDDDAPSKKAGSRQATPSFAWSVLLHRVSAQADVKRFRKFWDAVAASMFSPSASAERKALGFQVLSLIITEAESHIVETVLSSVEVLQCIIDSRANPERYLFDAVRTPLNHITARAKQDKGLSSILFSALVEHGAANFDQLTKTKTVEGIVAEADTDALLEIATFAIKLIERSGLTDPRAVENQRRALADLLVSAVRTHRLTGLVTSTEKAVTLAPWIRHVLKQFMDLGEVADDAVPKLTESSRSVFRNRLMSCLATFAEMPLEHAVIANQYVSKLASKSTALREKLPSNALAAVESAGAISKQIAASQQSNASMQAFQLLIGLTILQVCHEEPDSLPALEDLLACYQTIGQGDSTTVLIELLLSFISKPSALYRKLAEQVFSAFAAQLNAEGLESLIDVLQQKESLKGQQAMFETVDEDADQLGNGTDEDEEDSDDDDDDVDGAIDVEDDSDLELVNGNIVEKDDESESSSQSQEEDDASAEEDDEEAIFDKKLAEALGTSGMDGPSSDEDGSDMDDEQMMALEPHLTTIFKERQKVTSKKQDHKDAKENIVNFKNRVLDLLMIYVKSQYDSVLALDLILPLTSLIRTTGNKATAEKAFAVLKQYFESCSKNKRLPVPENEAGQNHEGCFELLTAVHEEVQLDGSKLHANACSRSSLFLCRIIVAMDPELYDRIASMYASLQSEWYSHPSSRIPSSMFTEWTSWSINTRRNH